MYCFCVFVLFLCFLFAGNAFILLLLLLLFWWLGLEEREVVDELVRFLRPFVVCGMYSVVDRLANATGREAVVSALYEALRVARSAVSREDRCLCSEDGVCKARAYVPRSEAIDYVVGRLDEDLVGGLEFIRRVVVRALAV